MNPHLTPEIPLGPAIAPGRADAAYDVVFLDRDGTINVRRPGSYVRAPDELVLLPGAAAAVAALNVAGIRVVLVTNQRGIATGAMTAADVERVHERLAELLAAQGAWLDAIEVCPHHVGSCSCRKPLPGLFLRGLARARWAQAEKCALVGDATTDIEPALGLGMRALLLGRDAPDLSEAVALLLGSRDAVPR